MRKFTIFTVILTVVVLVVVADLVVNKYLPSLDEEGGLELSLPISLDLSETMETNVLGSGGLTNRLGADIEEDEEEPPDDGLLPSEPEYVPPSTSTSNDFEDDTYVAAYLTNVYIRDEQVQAAGFVDAYLVEEPHQGFLYKTIYIDDFEDTEVDKVVVTNETDMMAKIYVFKIGPGDSQVGVYNSLKLKASQGLEVEINETDDYGDGSFYMNDSTRPNIAFLTVKVGPLIYGFSYPKEYHPQISNLIKLLMWEFGV